MSILKPTVDELFAGFQEEVRAAEKKERRMRGPVVIVPGGSGQTYHFEDGFTAYAFGVYPRSSILAGQTLRTFLGHYATLIEAVRAHPDAKIQD